MPLTVTTWNINSVRLRIGLVARFVKAARPDVLCLQETKCPDDAFPLKRFRRLGYHHVALNGQKGYHGVAVLSRVPFEAVAIDNYCGKTDCRHVAVTLGEKAGLRDPVTLHNFYVPAGGDEPDPAVNPKFAHKLSFLDELHAMEKLRPAAGERAILVGDLNVAPLEHDVWSHKQMLKWCRTRRSVREAHRIPKVGGGSIRCASSRPSRRSSTRGGASRDGQLKTPTAAAASTTLVSPQLGDRVARIDIARAARGWERPSDHVPVTATVET